MRFTYPAKNIFSCNKEIIFPEKRSGFFRFFVDHSTSAARISRVYCGTYYWAYKIIEQRLHFATSLRKLNDIKSFILSALISHARDFISTRVFRTKNYVNSPEYLIQTSKAREVWESIYISVRDIVKDGNEIIRYYITTGQKRTWKRSKSAFVSLRVFLFTTVEGNSVTWLAFVCGSCPAFVCTMSSQ